CRRTSSSIAMRQMRGASFADTNTLLYLIADDARKAAIAELLLGERLTISVQVLNESANVVLRKWRRSWDDMALFLALVRGQTTVVPLTTDTHELGLDMAERYQFSIYDSMIVAAALLADCDTLYSEDLHHGLVVEDRLRIVDPFREPAL